MSLDEGLVKNVHFVVVAKGDRLITVRILRGLSGSTPWLDSIRRYTHSTNHILCHTIHRPYIDMKTVSTHACLCNNFQLMPGTHPEFCGGQLDSSCLLPWPTIHHVISNSSSKSCESTTLTRRVFNTKYNIYRDLSITHSVHTELYHLIISELICCSKVKAVPCIRKEDPIGTCWPCHLWLFPRTFIT